MLWLNGWYLSIKLAFFPRTMCQTSTFKLWNRHDKPLQSLNSLGILCKVFKCWTGNDCYPPQKICTSNIIQQNVFILVVGSQCGLLTHWNSMLHFHLGLKNFKGTTASSKLGIRKIFEWGSTTFCSLGCLGKDLYYRFCKDILLIDNSELWYFCVRRF